MVGLGSEFVIEVASLTLLTLHFSIGRSGYLTLLHKANYVGAEQEGVMDLFTHTPFHLRERLGIAEAGLCHDHNLRLSLSLNAESHCATFADPCNPCDLKLDVLRVVVPTVANDEILSTACDVKLALGLIAQVAGIQPTVA